MVKSESVVEKEVKRIQGLLNLLCDAGDEQNDEDMEEYAEDISAHIDDVSCRIGVVGSTEFREIFLSMANKITRRPVKSYFEQAMEE